MARILILGYGNPLRSDDGLGWRAAEELSRTLVFPQVEIITRQQLTPELAEPLSRAEVAFFLDVARDSPPGELNCKPVTPDSNSNYTSHHCPPALLLTLSQQLYGAAPRAFLISLGGECFDHGETLSTTVQAGLPRLVELAEKMVREVI
jgi:hydrogenase maturation protease